MSNVLGKHVIAELWVRDPHRLNDSNLIRTALEAAAKSGDFTIVHLQTHAFAPHGVTAIVLLSESHMSIHTWPEHAYAAVDIFTCGGSPEKALAELERRLDVERMEVQELDRGVLRHAPPGRELLLGIEKWIFRERSEYQEVAIAAVPQYGKALFLDAVVEFVEADEFVYHESVSLPPLLFHPAPKRVLIAGGGDGLVLREVLRDPRVQEVVLVELDGLVVDACREHLHDLHRGSFDDPRASILIRDVFPYLETRPPAFDIVLVDLLDGYDATALKLYRRVLELLTGALRPDGIVGGFGDLATPHVPVGKLYRGLSKLFSHVALHRATIESFGGEYGFVLASNAVDFQRIDTETVQERARALGELRAVVPETFPVSFRTPKYVQQLLHSNRGETGPPPSHAFRWLE